MNTAEVDRLDGNQLASLNERQVPLEALHLVQAVNRLMRRLALALERQRRLVSDAAHELRVLGSKESGSGLGLAIARTASDALGGVITLGKRRDHRTGLRFIYRQAAL